MLMLIIAEFFRYWIHRALHVYGPLWKLHAVHHASDKLYTINVGRFHPFDKAIQFLGDTAPFLLLGVNAEVFAAYFVLYAINGFYQHSNADVRLGFLNYIIAGPELHRWHHSAKIAEANANYGNNLIVWDTVFGTRFLPSDREVGRIGIGRVTTASSHGRELGPVNQLGCFLGTVALGVHERVGANLEHPRHPHEFALCRTGHDVRSANAGCTHHLGRRLQTAPVMLHVHPNAIESH